jgi:hypothetical protein
MFDTPSNGAAMPELLKNPRTKTPIHLVKIFAMFMIDRISWFLGPALIRPCFGVLGQPGRHQMICPRSHLISAFGLLLMVQKVMSAGGVLAIWMPEE